MTRLYTVQKIDKMGRIVLPIEMLRVLDLDSNDFVRFHLKDDRIILKKQEPGCCFCGENKNLQRFQKVYICKNCFQDLKKIPT